MIRKTTICYHSQHCFFYMCCVLQCHSTVTATINGWSVLSRARVFVHLYFAPQSDEVIQPPQISVFVVALDPGGAVVDGDIWCEGNSLSEVNEVDTAQVCTVVYKQE